MEVLLIIFVLCNCILSGKILIPVGTPKTIVVDVQRMSFSQVVIVKNYLTSRSDLT